MGTPIPKNRAYFEVSYLLRVVQGELLHDQSERELGAVRGVSTDTRTIEPGGLFVALRGDNHDGHDYLAKAAEKGARAALVEKPVDEVPGLLLIRVRSTLDALGELASVHYERWGEDEKPRTVFAITGSAGKTTTRVALAALLKTLFSDEEVLATEGNLNNRVGLPMMVFGLEDRHTKAVFEMGMNQPGEIEKLASIVQPDFGIVTLVSSAHVEGVGSIEGVAHEKGALFRALPPYGTAVGNGDDPRVVAQMNTSPAKRHIRYGVSEGVDLRIVDRTPEGLAWSRVTLECKGGSRFSFRTPLIGEAGAYACAAALAVMADVVGNTEVDATAVELIEQAFARAEVGGGAGRLVPRMLARDIVVLDDSYNANPASSSASIRTAAELAKSEGRRLVLVLGAMYELGHESARGHDDVGRVAAESGAALVIAVNGDARRIADRASEAGIPAQFFETSADAAPAVALAVQPGDLVLVKGSRGVGTERIVRALAEVPS